MDTIIFRTTNECNLRCKYCYDASNHSNCISKTIATKEFADNEEYILSDVKKILRNCRKPQLIFHGGEPLLVDSDLLSSFCQTLSNDIPVRYSIQTNGTLINNQVINLFRKNQFQVGLSLDGADEEQNSARVYKNGRNSFHTVMEKINLLQQEQIRFGVIISVNKLHIGREQQLYDFLAQTGIHCNIRPVFSSTNGDNSFVMSPEEYITFFNNLFDIWYNDQERRVSTAQIHEFLKELRTVVTNEFVDRSCECSPNCFLNFISLDTNGNLYACNRLYRINEFYYGNIRNMEMKEVEAKALQLIKKRLDSINKQCRNCKLLKVCYGGCPAEAYSSYLDISRPSDYCQIRKGVHEHVKKIVLSK